jgi:hypothetical protein
MTPRSSRIAIAVAVWIASIAPSGGEKTPVASILLDTPPSRL